MPKRNSNKSRRMRGGFLDSLSNSISSGWNSVSQGASSVWDKTKNAASSAYTSASNTYSSATTPSPTYTAPSTTPSTVIPDTPTPMSPSSATGGKKRRTKKMRGGYSSNIMITGLAASASPISGIKSAQPHHWVGGRTKRRRTKCHRCNSKSCSCNSKSCRCKTKSCRHRK